MMKIDLTLGQVAIVDERDYEMLSKVKWHATKRRDGKGYYAKNSKGERMHRYIMGVSDGRIVDHIDGDGLNNARANLRIGNQSQNCVNRKTTPGVRLRGVRKKKDLWQAYIKYQGRQKSLGYFKTEVEAHDAYLAEAIRLHGSWMPLPAAPQLEAE
ncbi:HNH endonuclease [Citrobacter sp. RHB21-C01]|uniref:HNH endonuclease n=1 Tax=Citrobacter sp. RHB21-C01 TaxID=2742622 RepID=UPI0034D4B30A